MRGVGTFLLQLHISRIPDGNGSDTSLTEGVRMFQDRVVRVSKRNGIRDGFRGGWRMESRVARCGGYRLLLYQEVGVLLHFFKEIEPDK